VLQTLDSCEHLLDPVAEPVDALRRACRGLLVLATSQAGLALDRERVVPVQGLSALVIDADVATVADSDVVRLFVERASSVDPELELTDSNPAAVAMVC
jgi:non-specific serine/threonine protein kinase